MLESGSLHFARVDQLADPFEGTLSKVEYDRWVAVAEAAENNPDRVPPSAKGKYLEWVLETARRTRREMYVNCWHRSEGESEAMWRLYSRSGYAIAVQSEYGRLVNVLPQKKWEQCFVGLVTYADHDTDVIPEGNGFNPIMHKRRAFEHEREVRAVIWRPTYAQGLDADNKDWPIGIEVPVSLTALISRIVVSPEAPEWFAKTVQAVVDRYAVTVPVDKSQLLAKPYI